MQIPLVLKKIVYNGQNCFGPKCPLYSGFTVYTYESHVLLRVLISTTYLRRQRMPHFVKAKSATAFQKSKIRFINDRWQIDVSDELYSFRLCHSDLSSLSYYLKIKCCESDVLAHYSKTTIWKSFHIRTLNAHGDAMRLSVRLYCFYIPFCD